MSTCKVAIIEKWKAKTLGNERENTKRNSIGPEKAI